MKPIHLGVLAFLQAFAISSPAAVVYDLSDTVLSGNGGANTFVANTDAGASLGSTGSSLNYQVSDATNGYSYVVAYFNPVTLANVGDTISLRLTYTQSSATAFSPTDGALRLGFFNSGGNSVTGNVAADNAQAFLSYDGYAAMLRARSGTVAASNTLTERSGDDKQFWSSGAYSAVGAAPVLPQVSTAGATLVYEIEKLSSGTQISITVGGQTFTAMDTSGTTETFDAVSLFALAGGANSTLTFSEFTVSVVPEPGVSLLGLAAAAMLGLRGGPLSLRKKSRSVL